VKNPQSDDLGEFDPEAASIKASRLVVEGARRPDWRKSLGFGPREKPSERL